MTRVSTLVRLALQAMLWIVLLGFLVLIGLSRLTPYEALVVRSGSMEPTIATGGIVLVDRGARTPSVGSVASFRDPDGSLVTHRIVGLDGSRYITKGDANTTADDLHRPIAATYGTVVLSAPFLGFAIHLLQQPAAFLLLLLGTGGFLVVDALRTIAEELRRMRRERRRVDAP